MDQRPLPHGLISNFSAAPLPVPPAAASAYTAITLILAALLVAVSTAARSTRATGYEDALKREVYLRLGIHPLTGTALLPARISL